MSEASEKRAEAAAEAKQDAADAKQAAADEKAAAEQAKQDAPTDEERIWGLIDAVRYAPPGSPAHMPWGLVADALAAIYGKPRPALRA